jgi:hypothetical protein
MWSLPGAVTDTTAVVLVRTDAEASVVVQYDTDPGFGSAASTGSQNTTAGGGLATKFSLTSLTADTQYYYRVAIDGGSPEAATGAFRTAPAAGTATSFTIAASGDANTSSTHAVFAQIKAQSPRFFIHLGDLHYSDIATDSISLFRTAYGNSIGVGQQNALYRSCPFVYTWDDHDYGPNNSDASSASRPAARRAYREQVPSYPLSEGNPDTWDAPIYHAFTWGRVRFCVLDLRSERDPDASPDPTIMGAAQLQWLKDEISAAAATDQIVCVVMSEPYNGWTVYAEEREDLSNHIQSEVMNRRTFFLAADWHLLGIDDGSITRYATTPEPGLGPPLFVACPLHRSDFGTAPWSHGYRGPASGQGQYATLEFEDSGGSTITVTYRGYYVAGGGSTSTLWKSYSVALYTEEPPPPPPPEEVVSYVIKDRVKETSMSTGTGTISLDGPVEGFQSFVSAGDGAAVYYCIKNRDVPAEWEVGAGIVTDGTPDTLSRDAVFESSNGGSLVDFSTGTKEVFITAPAQALKGHGCAVTDGTLQNATTTPTAISWDTEVFDVGGYWTVGAPTRFTVPVGLAGLYLIRAVARSNNNTGAFRLSLVIQKNGLTDIEPTGYQQKSDNATSFGAQVHTEVLAWLEDGDYVEAILSAGATIDMLDSNNGFWIARLAA